MRGSNAGQGHDMKRRFKEYWTVEFDNYPVMDHYIKVPDPITIKADV